MAQLTTGTPRDSRDGRVTDWHSSAAPEAPMLPPKIELRTADGRRPAFPKPGAVIEESECPVCGVLFTPKKDHKVKRFCSLKCWYSTGQKAKSRKCCECGKTFANKNALRYCSNACFVVRSRRRKTVVCATCGQAFGMDRPACTTKYCTRKCYLSRSIEYVEFICLHCGQSCQHKKMGGRKRKFCSAECQWGHMVAENHPLYRGNRSHSRGATWKRQSTLARERDGNTCQGCGASGRELASIDHIVPFRLTVVYAQTDKLDPNDIRNLIALCRACHGRKTQAENKLLSGDLIGFLAAIRQFLPVDRVEAALNLWGLGRKKKMLLPFESVPKFVHKERLDSTVEMNKARRNKPCPPKGIVHADRRA